MTAELARDLPRDRTELGIADKKPLYSAAEARAEAERCLYCADAPCIKACPTEIDIPTFIKKIASGNVVGSASTIFDQNILGISCSRVCPVEVLCVGDCVYNGWHKEPIQIGKLQRFATETAVRTAQNKLFPRATKNANAKKVALIGAGPASLACAATLAMEGHLCTIFEKRALPGGLNTTGIAPYKLHAEDALREVSLVQSLGVEIKTGIEVGRVGSDNRVSGAALLQDFDVVYIGVGLGEDSKLKIPGEDGSGVALATEWIEQMKLTADKKEKLGRVLVIGGGNTALDVARESALLGAEDVAMVYRRSRKEMSGYVHELDGALKEGVRLIENRQPVSFVHIGHRLVGLRVAKTENGKVIPGSEEEIPCDLAVLAIGQSKLSAITAEFPGVQLDSKGCVVADPKNGVTGNPKVFAGGDCINGGKEVVNAVANGRDTARHLLSVWGK